MRKKRTFVLVILTMMSLIFLSSFHFQSSSLSNRYLQSDSWDCCWERNNLSNKNDTSSIANYSTEEAEVMPVGPITTSPNLNLSRPQDVGQKPRYLLSLVQNRTGFGNNVQYHFFRITVGQALLHNRTIVMVPFFNNGASGWGYNKDSMREFEHTFDTESLNMLLPITTMVEFRQQCSHGVQIALQDEKDTYFYESSIQFFESVYNINVPSVEELYPTSEIIPLLNSDVQCVALFHTYLDPKKRLPLTLSDSTYSMVNKHLLPAFGIQRTSKLILQEMCSGEPYLAVHYRNRTGEMCMYSERISHLCDDLLDENDKNANMLVNKIYKLWKERQFSCIYVAHPSWSTKFSYLLGQRIPSARVVNAHVIMQLGIDELDIYRKDNYFLSLLEQEICFHADLFIGWDISYWDKTIFERRQIYQKESVTFGRLLDTSERRLEQGWKAIMHAEYDAIKSN